MDLSDVRVALCPEDLERVGRFRYGIYIEEQGKTTRHADHANRVLIEPEDCSAKSLVLWIEREGRILGTVRAEIGPFDSDVCEQLQLSRLWFLPQERILYFTRMMIAPDMRNSDVTKKLFFVALSIAVSKNLYAGVLSCRPELRLVFESYGCLQYGPEYIHHEAGLQAPMAVLGEPDYFTSLQSPVVEWLRSHRTDSPYTHAFLEIAASFRNETHARRASRLASEITGSVC